MLTEERIILTPKLIFGAFIALLGVVLTLDNFGLIESRHVLRYWSLLLVALGVSIFWRARDVSGKVSGALLGVVGVWFLANALGVMRVRIWELFWPLVLIILGTSIILQTLRPRRPLGDIDPTSVVGLFAVMSGTKHRSSSHAFQGGDMTAIMGGCELDLRQATIAGSGAALDLLAFMGGHEIRVPLGWRVVSKVLPVMGGVVDHTVPPKDGEAAPTLVLRGFVMMGGVEVKH